MPLPVTGPLRGYDSFKYVAQKAIAAAMNLDIPAMLSLYCICEKHAEELIGERPDMWQEMSALQYTLKERVLDACAKGVVTYKDYREQPPESGAFSGAHRRVSSYGDRF